MREDFVTRLQLQLRDAAEREAQRGAVRRTARDWRQRLRAPELAWALAVALAGIAVVAGLLAMNRDEVGPTGPVVVAEAEFTGNPEQILGAFGAAWIADPVAGQIVRVDPERRRVTERIAVTSGQRLSMAPVGDELWVNAVGVPRVERIDPATNRVVSRLTLRTPGGDPFPAFGILVADGAVWAHSSEGALQLDPRTGTARRLVGAPTAGGEARWVALGADVLWVYDTAGVIRRYDPETGAALGRIRPQLPGTVGIEDFDGDLLAFTDDGRVGRLDGADGAVRWQRGIGDAIHGGDFAEDVLWVHATTAGDGDRLLGLDPRDGAVRATLRMDGFGSTGVALIGDELWIDAAGGTTTIVRP